MTVVDPDKASTLREIDTAICAAKGTAFRMFKQLAPRLREGMDFCQLRAGTDDARIAELRKQQRIYASSVHALLLSADARLHIIEAWENRSGE